MEKLPNPVQLQLGTGTGSELTLLPRLVYNPHFTVI